MTNVWVITIVTAIGMMIRTTIPILYATTGGFYSFKSGVYNFSLEGTMLCGAFFAYFGALMTNNLWLGLLLAVFMGGLTGAVLSYLSVVLKVSVMAVGIGINVFYLGLTGVLFRYLSSVGLSASLKGLMPNIEIPVLSQIPFVGNALFSHNVMVYLGLAIALFTIWLFKYTHFGLSFMAVGENEKAAAAAGINVDRYKILAVIICGGLSAMGGAFLTLTQTTRFVENLVDGRGWIAIAVIILGGFDAKGALWGSFLFGLAATIANQMQIIGLSVPYQVPLMAPYILTITALAYTNMKGNKYI